MAPSDESPGRTLLAALGAMVGVALLVGVAVGGVAMVAVNLVGVGDTETTSEEAPESLFMPKYQPTESADEDLGLPDAESSPTPELDAPSEEPSPPANRIKLFVAPQNVSPGQRINFNGVYGGGEGAELQIQRKENGTWTDFPVTATVRGGSFETWIQTSRTGRGVFRVYDGEADRGSNPVTVTIG